VPLAAWTQRWRFTQAPAFIPGSHHRETISGFVILLQIDHAEDVVGEAVEVGGDVA
jgi:hypothetical protein